MDGFLVVRAFRLGVAALTVAAVIVSVPGAGVPADAAGGPPVPAVLGSLPVITISGGVLRFTNNRTPTVDGTTEVAPGSLVSVAVGGQTLTTLVQLNGTWNVTPSPLGDGASIVVASVDDGAGNLGSATQELFVDSTAPVVTIDNGAIALTTDSTPALAGTVVDGTLTVSIDGQTVPGVSQSGTGWTVAFPAGRSPLASGDHFIVVIGSDGAGNVTTVVQTLTVDTAVPVISIAPGEIHATNDRTPTISGTTDVAAGATVSVTIDAGSVMTATVQSGVAPRTWNVTPSAVLDPGDHLVVATVLDPGGNVGTFAQTLTIDIDAPTSTIVGGLSRSTADATPNIAGASLDVAVGSAVIVAIDGQRLSTTIGADGTWSVTAASILNGIHPVLVTITDAAGNTGYASQSLTINAVPPTVAISGGAAASTNDSTPTIHGTSGAAVGSAAIVTVATQTLNATVQPGGTWNVTAAHLATGMVVVTVWVTDDAGNVGTASQNLTIASDQPFTPVNPANPAAPAAMADFTSVGPKRVFDTRAMQSPHALRVVAKQQVGGGHELNVKMTDLIGFVPATGVGAVSLNVTATGSTADGFITVYGCGTRELVSSVNFTAGGTVANAVIAPVSATGTVCFYANAPTDIVVDVNGWFALGSAFTSIGPKRVLDTRAGNSPDALRAVAKSRIEADSVLEVRLTDLAGYVPADGVGSVSLNVIVTNADAAGFITVYSCGTRAMVSSLNFAAGQTVANAVLAPVSAAGNVCFYSMATTDLIVDINGWLAAGSGFNAIDPARVLDTRPDNSPDALRVVSKVKIGGDNILEVRVADLAGRVPAVGVTAVSLNVTATNPQAAGFIIVYACGLLEEVSSLNFGAGATVANAVIAPVSAAGTICLYSNVLTDVIVDINGWIAAAEAG